MQAMPAGALEAARKGQEIDPASDAPAALALEMIDPGQPQAEPIVTRYLNNNPCPTCAWAYARVLVENRRYGDASTQLQDRDHVAARPGRAVAAARQPADAGQAGCRGRSSLKRFIELSGSQGKGAGAGVAADADDRKRGVAQAYLRWRRSRRSARTSPPPSAGWTASRTRRTWWPRRAAAPPSWPRQGKLDEAASSFAPARAHAGRQEA
jgi:hypothetical protein